MIVNEKKIIPGPFQDTITYKYDSKLTINDINKIFEEIVEKGNDIMGIGVKFDEDHSNRTQATIFPTLEEYLEQSRFLEVDDIEHISFVTYLGDIDTSNVIYPNDRYRTESVWNDEMLKSFEKKNNNSKGL